MSFLIVAGERYALELGDTVLGGTGPGALAAPETAQLPAALVISYPEEGASTARSLRAVAVTINGAALGDIPCALRHGDRIMVGELEITYGHTRQAGRTAHVATVKSAVNPMDLLQTSQAAPAASTGGRVTRVSDGTAVAVPDSGLTLGRDASSHVVLSSPGVSRTHAVIAPSLLGYTLKDQSTNGVWVNGTKVDGLHVLGQGDVLRIGDEEFRFDADDASFEPTLSPVEAAPAAPRAPVAAPRAPVTAESPTTPRPQTTRLLATLEVLTEGPMHGVRFRLDRPTIQLGRGPYNDIRLDNDSVSTTHASLIQRGGRWLIMDLNSRNGTRVDGEMVREQHELPAVCEVQLGALRLLFRAINAGEQGRSSTIGVIAVK